MSELSDREFRERALERDGYECRYCGSSGKPGKGLEAHHIEHDAEGGPTVVENALTLCKDHHGIVHVLGASGDDPLEVLNNYDVPKTIPDVRGMDNCTSVMVLDVLREGRANPKWIKEKTGLNDQKVNYALNQLMAAGWVRKVTKGLYEFVADPREDDYR